MWDYRAIEWGAEKEECTHKEIKEGFKLGWRGFFLLLLSFFSAFTQQNTKIRNKINQLETREWRKRRISFLLYAGRSNFVAKNVKFYPFLEEKKMFAGERWTSLELCWNICRVIFNFNVFLVILIFLLY